MTLIQFIYLLLAGICTVFGQFGATLAYKYAPAKDISIFDYAQVLFATILSALFLGAMPTYINMLGYIIIHNSYFITIFYYNI